MTYRKSLPAHHHDKVAMGYFGPALFNTGSTGPMPFTIGLRPAALRSIDDFGVPFLGVIPCNVGPIPVFGVVVLIFGVVTFGVGVVTLTTAFNKSGFVDGCPNPPGIA